MFLVPEQHCGRIINPGAGNRMWGNYWRWGIWLRNHPLLWLWTTSWESWGSLVHLLQELWTYLERLGVKRKQTEQAEGMMTKSARRYAPALVGDNVRVYLADVDKGRCEFPNVLAVVVSTSEEMFKLATKDGYLNSHYARNQFETLTTKHLLLSDVNTSETRALRTAANAQSTGGGQGFTRCGCNKACQTNACKCIVTKLMCNSRCHGPNSNPRCFSHD